MPMLTPNMVNMMMQTQPANVEQQQPIPEAIASQLGGSADLAQHSQQLGAAPLLSWHSVPSMNAYGCTYHCGPTDALRS